MFIYTLIYIYIYIYTHSHYCIYINIYIYTHTHNYTYQNYGNRIPLEFVQMRLFRNHMIYLFNKIFMIIA